MRLVIRIRNRIQTELPLVFYFIFPVKWTKIRVFQFPILLFNKKKKKKGHRKTGPRVGYWMQPTLCLFNVTMRRMKKNFRNISPLC